jgi:hypothetical protein
MAACRRGAVTGIAIAEGGVPLVRHEGKLVLMNRLFAMIVGMPLLACGTANVETSTGSDSPHAVSVDSASTLQPTYEVTVEPGHVVKWFELGPGRAVSLESMEQGQTYVLEKGMSIADQFRALRPGVELPEALRTLVERSEALRDAPPEELRALLEESGKEVNAGVDEPLIEAQLDVERPAAPGLSPLSTGASDTGADDSAFSKSYFIDWSDCDQTGLSEVRRLKRTGSDDSQINYKLHVNAFIASYRGTVSYILKARVDYELFYGGWQTLVDGADVKEGTGKTWRVDHPGTLHIDVKGHVRDATNNGWHACLKQTL